MSAAFCIGPNAGCSSACDTSDDNNPPELYTGGMIVGDVYWSAPVGGEWLHFPGGKRYEIVHELGVCPQGLECWISFSSHGIGTVANGDTATLGSGNACELEAWNERSIVIKNATCSEFWLMVKVNGSGGALCDGGLPSTVDAGAGEAEIDGALE